MEVCNVLICTIIQKIWKRNRSRDLNGGIIKSEDIIYDYDDNGFRFYSSQYKDNNIINLIIKNKKQI